MFINLSLYINVPVREVTVNIFHFKKLFIFSTLYFMLAHTTVQSYAFCTDSIIFLYVHMRHIILNIGRAL